MESTGIEAARCRMSLCVLLFMTVHVSDASLSVVAAGTAQARLQRLAAAPVRAYQGGEADRPTPTLAEGDLPRAEEATRH